MPYRAFRPCTKPGCGKAAVTRQSRCVAHLQQARAQSDRKREREGKRFGYNSSGHRTFRAGVLDAQPYCAECGQRATVADHYPRTRRELIDQGCNPDDPAYGRGLCTPCHNSHTAKTNPQNRIEHPS